MLYYPTLTLPADLQKLQYINFQAGVHFEQTYEAGLRELLEVLAAEERAGPKAERTRRVAKLVRPASGILALAALFLAFVVIFSSLGSGILGGARPAGTATLASTSPTADVVATNIVRADQTTLAGVTQTVGAFLTQPYVAPKPGPSCDTNPGAQWEVATYSQDGKVSCGSDGLIITNSASVIFHGVSGSFNQFPLHFNVGVDLRLSGANTCAWLSRLAPGAPNEEGGSVVVCQGGWKTTIPGAAAPHAVGHVTASAAYALVLSVQTGRETMSINGVQVDSAALTSDWTPTELINLQSGVFGGGSSSTLFKNFKLTPLP